VFFGGCSINKDPLKDEKEEMGDGTEKSQIGGSWGKISRLSDRENILRGGSRGKKSTLKGRIRSIKTQSLATGGLDFTKKDLKLSGLWGYEGQEASGVRILVSSSEGS